MNTERAFECSGKNPTTKSETAGMTLPKKLHIYTTVILSSSFYLPMVVNIFLVVVRDKIWLLII